MIETAVLISRGMPESPCGFEVAFREIELFP